MPGVGNGQRVSLRGRLFVPTGAVSSGLHVLSADGGTFSRLFNVPLKFVLTAIVLGVVVSSISSTGCYGWFGPPTFLIWQVSPHLPYMAGISHLPCMAGVGYS